MGTEVVPHTVIHPRVLKKDIKMEVVPRTPKLKADPKKALKREVVPRTPKLKADPRKVHNLNQLLLTIMKQAVPKRALKKKKILKLVQMLQKIPMQQKLKSQAMRAVPRKDQKVPQTSVCHHTRPLRSREKQRPRLTKKEKMMIRMILLRTKRKNNLSF